MFCAIKLSKSDPTPLYIQLANELSKLIKDGSIPEKTKLPTIRAFSHNLKINRDTVVSAYKLLENQGLIVAHVGSGTYVAPSINLPLKSPHLPPSITCSSISFPKELFPISIGKDLVDKVLTAEGWSAFSDPLYRERHFIKQSISTYLKSVGITSLPAQVRLIKDFYTFLVDLMRLSPKHCICVEAYHDLTYTSFMRSLGTTVIEVPLEKDGMDLTVLESHLESSRVGFIWISSYVQNPTGLSYSEQKKKELIALAKKYDCYIIEDATLSDFSPSISLLTPLYNLDQGTRSIYLYHFSRLYLPETNYTFIVLPHNLIKQLPDKLECTLNERILHYYLESSTLSQLRATLIENSYKKQQKVLQHLSRSTKLSHVFTDQGCLFFWITPKNITVMDACQYFIQHHIIISPGNLFSSKSQVDAFRLSIANLSNSTLETLLTTIDNL